MRMEGSVPRRRVPGYADRGNRKIGQAGFEPATPSPPDLYANQLRYCPNQ